MIVELVSQIDVEHWTVRFLSGEWKDRVGDYEIAPQNLDAGQHLEVEVKPFQRRPEPTINGYCGVLKVLRVASAPAEKKGKKKGSAKKVDE